MEIIQPNQNEGVQVVGRIGAEMRKMPMHKAHTAHSPCSVIPLPGTIIAGDQRVIVNKNSFSVTVVDVDGKTIETD